MKAFPPTFFSIFISLPKVMRIKATKNIIEITDQSLVSMHLKITTMIAF